MCESNVVWPTAQTAAPMAPRVMTVTHTAIIRQGVKTQVREMALLPALTDTRDTYTCTYINMDSFNKMDETPW